MTLTVQPAKRTAAITYAVRDVLIIADEAKKAGKDMLYLNVGDPNKFDFDVPEHLIEHVYKAMKSNHNGYGPSQGEPTGLDAIRREADRKGIRSVQDVFTGYGASEAIELCISALADPGDNIILPSPGYPLYSALNAKLNIESRFYPLVEEENWQPDVEYIRGQVNEKTKAIVLINPNNPTGTIYSKQVLEDILEIAREHRLVVFSDEIYDKMILDADEEMISIASLADDVPIVTFGGLSKCYLAPGWRIGWAIMSGPSGAMKDYIEAIHKMTRARLCITNPMQHAIAPALEGDQSHIQAALEKMRRRRDITYERLNAIDGISCVKPQASFYAFPKIENCEDDNKFVADFIRESGVVIVPGSGFGELSASGHFRIVFLPQEEKLEMAYQRLEDFIKKSL